MSFTHNTTHRSHWAYSPPRSDGHKLGYICLVLYSLFTVSGCEAITYAAIKCSKDLNTILWESCPPHADCNKVGQTCPENNFCSHDASCYHCVNYCNPRWVEHTQCICLACCPDYISIVQTSPIPSSADTYPPNVPPFLPSNEDDDSAEDQTGLIIGYVLGAVFIISVIVAVSFFCVRRRRQADPPDRNHDNHEIVQLNGDHGRPLHRQVAETQQPESATGSCNPSSSESAVHSVRGVQDMDRLSNTQGIETLYLLEQETADSANSASMIVTGKE